MAQPTSVVLTASIGTHCNQTDSLALPRASRTHTRSFDTAVEEAQRALLAAKVEASSAYRGIGLVKLMGRQSGFIAMQASMASGVVDIVSWVWCALWTGVYRLLCKAEDGLSSRWLAWRAGLQGASMQSVLPEVLFLACGLRPQCSQPADRASLHAACTPLQCLIPEVPFKLAGETGMLAYLEKVLNDKGHAVVCVAEGAGQVCGRRAALEGLCVWGSAKSVQAGWRGAVQTSVQIRMGRAS